MSATRKIHFGGFAAIVAIAIGLWVCFPELWTGKATTFGTLSGLITLYGLIFTAVEVVRARSASELAKEAAQKTQNHILNIINVKNISECQSCIKFSIADLERDGWVSTANLARIIELYTAEFHEKYEIENSHHRLAIVALQSHAANASGPLNARTLVRLKATLMVILADVTAAAGGKLSETK